MRVGDLFEFYESAVSLSIPVSAGLVIDKSRYAEPPSITVLWRAGHVSKVLIEALRAPGYEIKVINENNGGSIDQGR